MKTVYNNSPVSKIGKPCKEDIYFEELNVEEEINKRVKEEPKLKELMHLADKEYQEKKRRKLMEEQYDFGTAMQHMKNGRAFARKGWNASGMTLRAQRPDQNSKMTHPYLYMTVPDCEEGTRKLPWQPSQVDLFAEDWIEIV